MANDPKQPMKTIMGWVPVQQQPQSESSPDSSQVVVPADSVTWQYTPNGAGNCQQFDGGDGSFPPADAPMDSLPQVLDVVATPL